MKKNIIDGLVFISLTVLMTACGSNTKPDGNVGANIDASMSILLEGIVRFDQTRGCEKLFVVHAIDGNGNPIPNLNVDASIIIDKKASGNNVGVMQTTEPITFLDSRYSFSAENIVSGDKLIILPTQDRHDATYTGDWNIHKVQDSSLELRDAAYNLETTDKLSYIAGNEAIYVPGYGTAVAHIEKDDTNGTTVTNSDGYAYFKVVYDLSLIGYPMAVGAHTSTDYRIGAAVLGRLPDCVASIDVRTTQDTNNSTP